MSRQNVIGSNQNDASHSFVAFANCRHGLKRNECFIFINFTIN